MSDVDELIADLVDAGLLTERQATAFVLREIENTPVLGVMEALETESRQTAYNTTSRAREIVEQARDTVELIDGYRYHDPPLSCSECGTGLGGRFSVDDEDNALCPDCAGLS